MDQGHPATPICLFDAILMASASATRFEFAPWNLKLLKFRPSRRSSDAAPRRPPSILMRYDDRIVSRSFNA